MTHKYGHQNSFDPFAREFLKSPFPLEMLAKNPDVVVMPNRGGLSKSMLKSIEKTLSKSIIKDLGKSIKTKSADYYAEQVKRAWEAFEREVEFRSREQEQPTQSDDAPSFDRSSYTEAVRGKYADYHGRVTGTSSSGSNPSSSGSGDLADREISEIISGYNNWKAAQTRDAGGGDAPRGNTPGSGRDGENPAESHARDTGRTPPASHDSGGDGGGTTTGDDVTGGDGPGIGDGWKRIAA